MSVGHKKLHKTIRRPETLRRPEIIRWPAKKIVQKKFESDLSIPLINIIDNLQANTKNQIQSFKDSSIVLEKLLKKTLNRQKFLERKYIHYKNLKNSKSSSKPEFFRYQLNIIDENLKILKQLISLIVRQLKNIKQSLNNFENESLKLSNFYERLV
ncbi:MAG: hypothetical protein JWM09_159 [Francisellaceae bacterium]|nr:hypothetical protein [Francisellaceae bacterium]